VSRNFDNWINGYIDYTDNLEAPLVFHLWTGIATIAGALRGKCWIDMGYFKWKPNFFVVFVAPPGIVSKSTTLNVGMGLLRQVEGVHFGPESATWQAVTDAFREAEEVVPQIADKMSALTIVASELGTFLDPKNREMIDILNDLWDGRSVPWQRRTKGEGTTEIQNPWLNFAGCTTPAWIQENFPQYAIGGGFTSRTVFVYGEEKRALIAYPKLEMDSLGNQYASDRLKLVNDLRKISALAGEFVLTNDAIEWGKDWYARHWKHAPQNLNLELYGGYIARKQTHIHKLAMVISAAERDDMVIHPSDLARGHELITSLEPSFARVFSALADNREVHYLAALIKLVERHRKISKVELWRQMMHIMTHDQFEGALRGALIAERVREFSNGSGHFIVAPHKSDQSPGITGDTPSHSVVPFPSDLSSSAEPSSTDESSHLSAAASGPGLPH
jgi:hypothetical protein